MDHDAYPEYLNLVCYEMYLTRIIMRLSNFYYRSQEQIEIDLDLIRENSAVFNGPESKITQIASLFVQHIKLMIAGDV